MDRPGRYGRAILSLLVFGTAGVIAIILRYVLSVPQSLVSAIPGDGHLYRWTYGDIYYKVTGAAGAPPLVLVHSPEIGASSYSMKQLVAGFASQYRVYTFDLIGFGLSDHPDIAYTAETYSSLCEDFLLDVVRAPAILVSQGLACQYIVSLATRVPQLCTRLVLISPEVEITKKYPAWLEGALLYSPLGLFIYSFLTIPPVLGFFLANRHGSHSRKITREYLKNVTASAHQSGAEHAALAWLVGKAGLDLSPQAKSLQQPVCMIQGAHEHSNSFSALSLLQARSHTTSMVLEYASLPLLEYAASHIVTAIHNWLSEKTSVLSPDGLPSISAIHAGNLHNTTQLSREESSKSYEWHGKTKASIDNLENKQQETIDNSVGATMESLPRISDQTRVIETPGSSSDLANIEGLEPAKPAFSSEGTIVPLQTVNASLQSESTISLPLIEAYCVKCRQKREIEDAKKVVTKNGRNALEGRCPVCATRLFRFIAG